MTVALNPARRELKTARLHLRIGDSAGLPSMAQAICDYQVRNRAHFTPWDPPTPEPFFTVAGQRDRLAQSQQAFQSGSAMRYWLSLADAPARVIGMVHLSQINRGAYCNASLSYGLDQACQGRGLMNEALQALVEEAFSPHVNLHRLQAAYRPENQRSAAVLARLGFQHIGLSPDYLFIDGAWRDHQLCALLNPGFRTPPAW